MHKLKKRVCLGIIILLLFNTTVLAFGKEEYLQIRQEYVLSIDNFGSYRLELKVDNIDQLSHLSYAKEVDNPVYFYQEKQEEEHYYDTNEISIESEADEIKFGYYKTIELLSDVEPTPYNLADYAALTNFDNYEQYLVSETLYDYESDAIQSLKDEIDISTENLARVNIRKIINYVVFNTKYDLEGLGATPASQVAEEKFGVCSDYTALTVALLRSVGIPARGVGGIAMKTENDSKGAQHMWTEININGTWYILETTMSIKGIDELWLTTDLISKPTQHQIYLPLGEEVGATSDSSVEARGLIHGLEYKSSDYSITTPSLPLTFDLTKQPNTDSNDEEHGEKVELQDIGKEEFMINCFISLIDRVKGEQLDNKVDLETDKTHWAYNNLLEVTSLIDVQACLQDLNMDRKITRQEVAALIDAFLDLDTTLSTDEEIKFIDTTDSAVNRIAQLGIIQGYPDNSFKPDNEITRAELFTVLSRTLRYSELKSVHTPVEFEDMNNHWAAKDIFELAELIQIRGYEGYQLKPDDSITNGETITLLYRIIEAFSKTD